LRLGAAHHAAEHLHQVTAVYRQILTGALPGISLLPEPALAQHVEQATDTTGLLDEATDEIAHQILLSATTATVQHGTQNTIKQAHRLSFRKQWSELPTPGHQDGGTLSQQGDHRQPANSDSAVPVAATQ